MSQCQCSKHQWRKKNLERSNSLGTGKTTADKFLFCYICLFFSFSFFYVVFCCSVRPLFTYD